MSLSSEDLEARIKLILLQTERYAKIYALRAPSFDLTSMPAQDSLVRPCDPHITPESSTRPLG